jgi:hypothetical protein
MKILGLIYILCSYNGKMECYIPTLSSFEIIGISRHKIKHEIEKLIEAKVIDGDRENMKFIINKNFHEWKVQYSDNYQRDRFD